MTARGVVSPAATLGLTGVTAIDCNTAAVVVIANDPETPLIDAVIVELPVAMPVTRPALVTAA